MFDNTLKSIILFVTSCHLTNNSWNKNVNYSTPFWFTFFFLRSPQISIEMFRIASHSACHTKQISKLLQAIKVEKKHPFFNALYFESSYRQPMSHRSNPKNIFSKNHNGRVNVGAKQKLRLEQTSFVATSLSGEFFSNIVGHEHMCIFHVIFGFSYLNLPFYLIFCLSQFWRYAPEPSRLYENPNREFRFGQFLVWFYLQRTEIFG